MQDHQPPDENAILPNNEMGATNELTKPRGRPTTRPARRPFETTPSATGCSPTGLSFLT
jgi:hypothetical protein